MKKIGTLSTTKKIIIVILSASVLGIFILINLNLQRENVGFICIYPEDSSADLSQNECTIFADEIEKNRRFKLVSYYTNGIKNFQKKDDEDYYIILNRRSYCQYAMYTSDSLTEHSFGSEKKQIGHGLSSCMTDNRLVATELTAKTFLLKITQEKE